MSIIKGEVQPAKLSGYNIEQSLRFNDDDSAYLSRTPTVAGNRRTWTFSTWVKRGNLGTNQMLLAANTDIANRSFLILGTDNKLSFGTNVSNIFYGSVAEPLLRDNSSWYHILVVIDTTLSVSSDRTKYYINGELIPSSSSIFGGGQLQQNQDTWINNTVIHNIGSPSYTTGLYFDGYLAETHFIDGQALTPDNFGEFDETYGHWKPIAYDGTYGTNGFYLPFDDAGFIGKDKATVLGSELVTNGTFDSDTSGWSAGNGATLSVNNKKLRISGGTTNYPRAVQNIATEIGKTYVMSADFTTISGSLASIQIRDTNNSAIGYSNSARSITFTATETTTKVWLEINGITDNSISEFDNISVREITTNGNNFTATNLATTDIVKDSPTNNFATLNVLRQQGGVITSESNTEAYYPAGDPSIVSTFAQNKGKWYCEVLITNPTVVTGAIFAVGIVKSSNAQTLLNVRDDSGTIAYYGNSGYKYIDGVGTSYGSTYSTGDIVAVAIDFDAGNITFYKNNVSQGAISFTVGTNEWEVGFTHLKNDNTAVININFGQDSSFAGNKISQGYTDANGIGDFYYEPPAGYLALCTANLPEPTVVPSEHFDVVTYAGNNGSQTNYSSVDNLDFLWLKNRTTSGTSNLVYDIIRGNDADLRTNATDAERTSYDVDLLDNSFTVNGTSNYINATNNTYVAWNWKAGGTAVTNTDGTITSQVSANVDAGFSIVSMSNRSTPGDTVGHGLNQAPELIIQKQRNASNSWCVYDKFNGATKMMYLEATPASFVLNVWNNTEPTASVFTCNGTHAYTNYTGDTIAYCFHSVEGYSKIGTYIGNGSTDGVFVYCGFRPRYVMIKKTNEARDWTVFDSEINPYNLSNKQLEPNTSLAEITASTSVLDIVSNGFKLRGAADNLNTSGGTYLFYAIAESPFKYTNGR